MASGIFLPILTEFLLKWKRYLFTIMEFRKHVADDELVKPTLAIAAINGWNRFGIACRTPPGRYQPAHYAAAICI